MKRILFLFLLLPLMAASQEDAWVYFTDKPDAAYYLANPLEMLSQKALDRRARQNIALDDKDVPVSQTYIDAVRTSFGITIMAKSKWLNALHVRGSASDIRRLSSLSFIASITYADNTLNGRRKTVATSKSKAVSKQLNTQADYNYGSAATQIEMLNGHLLHQQDFTGTGLTIAVLDNGFPEVNNLPIFEHLYNNNLVLGTYNYVDRTDDVTIGGSHGTLVLSTMAGYKDGQLVGTAPDAFYYLFVTEDDAAENPVEESYWVQAAEAADSLGVDVINTSLGYFTYDNPAYSYTYENMDGNTAFMTRGANVAFSRGIFLVNSAGNSGAGSNPYISVPADAFNTLTVGAVDSSEQYAYFSSIGPSADGRVKPDVMAMGQGSAFSGTDGSIGAGSGTSFSSPITAGLVACLWQALPDKTNAELLQIIRQSADRYSNPDGFYGYGIPDFWQAYQSAALSVAGLAKNTIELYPNPATDVVYVVLPDEVVVCTAAFYNSLGQLVLQKTISRANNTIDISVLANGIYNYTISLKDGSAKQGKIIKL
ncbi:S8 family serine peptidase [Flavobacterium psychrotrophum]|uniref:S8 family serine peptidase n=1 Tax=Flavobacterium psychrotrophum TaxID=2294119 RepID=UPI000E32013F|nr:S8 family serine peptidase [Flavobacterium psychrotrophum]